jgi:hypothetical protein
MSGLASTLREELRHEQEVRAGPFGPPFVNDLQIEIQVSALAIAYPFLSLRRNM